MKILFAEPYYGGSHKNFLLELAAAFKKSQREIQCDVVHLPARHWRWRLQGAHFELAQMINSQPENNRPDVIVANSMMDTAAFRGLLSPALRAIPLATFFHENQLAYPVKEDAPNKKELQRIREFFLPAIHLNQVLASDFLIFNSRFNFESLFEGLDAFLKKMPDSKPLDQMKRAKEKSHILGLGARFPQEEPLPWKERPLRLLWNHRWEFDKNPEEFIDLFVDLKADFPALEVDLLGGDHQGRSHETFARLKHEYPEAVTFYGEIENRESYLERLGVSRLLPVTSHHDFFGLSVVEAAVRGVIPLLPNRLAYPELIAPELREKLLYQDFQDLGLKAKVLLKRGLEPEEAQLLSSWMNKFRWSAISEKFIKIIAQETK